MRRITIGIMLFAAALSSPASAGLLPDWGQEYGDEGTITRRSQEFSAVQADSSGNIYVAGNFQGQINLGGTTLFSTVSETGGDVFVAKLSSTGTHIWSLSGGGGGFDIVQDIDVAPGGGVVVVGQTTSSTFSVGTSTETTNGGSDAFIMLFSSNGTHNFTRIIGGPLNDVAHSVVRDVPNLDIYVSGTFWGTVDFGVGAPRTSNGLGDFFLAKIKVWGAMSVAGTTGGTGNEGWTALCLDSSGDLGFAGTFENTINFGNGPLTSTGARSVVVAKIPSIGSPATWSQGYGAAGSSDACYANSIDTDGTNFFMTGAFTGTANFGTGNHTSSGGNDVWVGAYKGDGNPVWSRSGGSSDYDGGNHIDYHDGLLAIAGQSEGPGTYDSQSVGHAGRLDALLLVYDVDGNIRHAKHGGGNWDDGASEVEVNENGFYLVGGFGEVAAFSGLTLNALDPLPDGFLVNYVENALVGVDRTVVSDLTGLDLGAPQPNPFREVVVLEYSAAVGSGIRSAGVYDVTGRLVRALEPSGATHSGLLRWDGRNEKGSRVSRGVYFVRVTDGTALTQRRVTVLR